MRVIAVLLGLVLLLFSGFMILVSSVSLWLVGWDSTLDTGFNRIDTPTSALFFDLDDLGGKWVTDWPFSDKDKGSLTVEAKSEDGKELFLGFGPTGDVKGYIGAGPYDEVGAFSDSVSSDAGSFDTKRRGEGDLDQLPAPTDQDFWTAHPASPGDEVELKWDLREGDYSAVIMNADGSPSVKTETKLKLHVPRLNIIFLVWLIIGVVLLLLALFLLFKVARRPRLVS